MNDQQPGDLWNRKALLAVAVTSLFVAGCEHIPGTKANKLAMAKELVASKMKDPTSVIFSDVRTSEDGGAVCGVLNAKNSYGAYTGRKAFFYRGGVSGVLFEGEDSSDNWGIAVDRRGKGTPVAG